MNMFPKPFIIKPEEIKLSLIKLNLCLIGSLSQICILINFRKGSLVSLGLSLLGFLLQKVLPLGCTGLQFLGSGVGLP